MNSIGISLSHYFFCLSLVSSNIVWKNKVVNKMLEDGDGKSIVHRKEKSISKVNVYFRES